MTNQRLTRFFVWTTFWAGCAVSVASCGGGEPTAGLSSLPSTLSGRVIDGPIEGATVCLDLNANQVCDTGEPTDTTRAGGGYSLALAGVPAEVARRAQVLAWVPSTAKDADDNGATLMQAGKKPFALMAPAEAYLGASGADAASAVVSPLTSLVSFELIADAGKPLIDAQAAVRQRLGLDASTALTQDFVDRPNVVLREKATLTAMALAETMGTVGNASAAPSTALLAGLSHLQEHLPAILKVASESDGGTALKKIQNALTQAQLVPDASKLLSATESTRRSQPLSGSATIRALEAGGIFFSGCPLVKGCTQPYYATVSVAEGRYSFGNFALKNNAWSALASTYPLYTLTPSGWVSEDMIAGTYVADDKAILLTQNATGSRARLTVRTEDIGGKSSVDLLAGRLRQEPINMTFATGSLAYWVSIAPLEDRYTISLGDKASKTDCTSSCIETEIKSLNALLTTFATSGASSNRFDSFYRRNAMAFTFDQGGNPSGGTVGIWKTGTSSCYINGWSMTSGGTPTRIGTAPYSIRTIHGQTVLVIEAEAAPGCEAGYPLLAVKDGSLHEGSYDNPLLRRKSSPYLNSVALRSVMSSAKLPAPISP